MFSKKYLVSVILDNNKDAQLVSAKEGYGTVNTHFDVYPLTLIIQKRRRYLSALVRCIEYFRMGIYCTVVRSGD